MVGAVARGSGKKMELIKLGETGFINGFKVRTVLFTEDKSCDLCFFNKSCQRGNERLIDSFPYHRHCMGKYRGTDSVYFLNVNKNGRK